MHPVTHLLTGWTLAHLAKLEQRDRRLVTVASILPDLDGLGVIADLLTERTRHPLALYDDFHHVLFHNVLAGILLTASVFALAQRRRITALLALLGFHLHLLGDLVGSRGPDGYQWPIPYLTPFSEAWQLTWGHQWGLKAWPNVTLTLLLLGLTLYWAWKRGRSPVELLSGRADASLVRTLRARFGLPADLITMEKP